MVSQSSLQCKIQHCNITTSDLIYSGIYKIKTIFFVHFYPEFLYIYSCLVSSVFAELQEVQEEIL